MPKNRDAVQDDQTQFADYFASLKGKWTAERDYLNLMRKVRFDGAYVGDRTNTGCYSLFGATLRFDLAKGFPLLTTKTINFSNIVGELLFFLQPIADRRILQEKTFGEYREDRHDIWKLDCLRAKKDNPSNFNGYNLGELYPELFRQVWEPELHKKLLIRVREDFDRDYIKPKTEMVTPVNEDLHVNNEGNTYRIIHQEYCTEAEKTFYKVQFADTGGITEGVGYGAIKAGQVKDRLHPKVFGVGYLGDKFKYNKKLYLLWRAMLERCYNKDSKNYSRYGAKGVSVSPRWHNFLEFTKDVYSLPNFQKWVNSPSEWALDKDYFGGKVYSRNTCVFLPKEINSKLCGIMLEKDGKFYVSISDAEMDAGLSPRGALDRMLAKGYTLVDDSKNEGFVSRPKLFRDQLQDLVSGLENRESCRRLVVSNWNRNHAETAVLPACHTEFQVVVREGKLNLRFTMRSSDVFLGLPYNIASYALLCHILAKLVGLEVGELFYVGTDVHLYSNHIDAVETQLSRTPTRPPELILPSFNSLEELLVMTAKDFKLEGYNPQGFIKAPQAS